MTDRTVSPDTRVPRDRDVDAVDERAELIHGLYQLAAWVADSPQVPLPSVTAHVPARGDDWQSQCAEVDRVGASLGVAPVSKVDGEFYLVDARFGSAEVKSVAISADYMAAYRVHMTDWDERRRVERDADRRGDAVATGGESR